MTRLAPLLAIVALVAFPAVAPAAPPPNDSLASAEAIGGPPASATGTTAEATSEPGEPQHANGTGHSVWWRWTAPESRTVAIEACGFESVLAVYRGTTLPDLLPVASNGAALPLCGAGSRVVFPAVGGEVYSIAVDAQGAATGPVTVWVRPAPENDNFAAARVLDGDFTAVVGQENAEATREPMEPLHAGNAGGHSLWYRWIPPAGGPATVDTCVGDLDTVVGIYTGLALGGLTEVASDDNGCSRPGGSFAEFTAAAGQTYWIAVDGRDGATGRFDLYLEGTPPPCEGLDCEDAEDDEDFEDEFESEPRPRRCSDGRDNDGDGRVDRADPGCKGPRDDDERGPRARPTAGNDRLIGTAGRDRLCGLAGDDRIKALAGADIVFGDACGRRARLRRGASGGDDRIDGGKGRDRLFGGPGSDSINARDDARDMVDCGPGRDRVRADRQDRLKDCERVLQ